ncbi:MAG: hypothetical protein E7028_05155 [Planctomycetaceae bacterium]|nr:hypothetical protein [Planctomycetaceae bacterium]
MARTFCQIMNKKAALIRRLAFGRHGVFCLLAGLGVLLSQSSFNRLCAQTGAPSGFYASENAANILPGTFSPEGNFSNAAVSRRELESGNGTDSGNGRTDSSVKNPYGPGHQDAANPANLFSVNQNQVSGTAVSSEKSKSGIGDLGDSAQGISSVSPQTLPQASVQMSSPGDLLSARNTDSPGSDELLAGGNGVNDNLPESAAMDIAPVNAPLGAEAESILSAGGQKDEMLPDGSDLPSVGTDSSKSGIDGKSELEPETEDSILGSRSDSRITKGNEHDGKKVLDVQIIGNQRHSTEKILQQIHLRTGHTFKVANLDDDILRMNQSRLFTLVEPYIRSVPGGVIVMFKVQERPVMHYLRFQGNGGISIGTLEKECGLVPGRPFSPYDVEEGRKKLETYYQSKGYAKVSVKAIQGSEIGDPGVIYLINPGPKLRIGNTEFIGNTIASDARLKTIIQSKPGFLWIFKGELRDDILQEDIRKLEDYYRRLGFFYARIGRRVKRTSEEGWNDVTFVIEEGPQAHINEIRYVGNTKFESSAFEDDMKIEVGKPFNKDRLDMSIMRVRRRYGKEGYVFANINAEMKILDDPGKCDIVFSIQEGKTYRVGRVNVLIEGEFPHTQISTVLNRLSVKPGDLVKVNELQQSERRLKASQLFANDPAQGKVPKIVYSPPELAEEAQVASQIGSKADAVGGSGNTAHPVASGGSAGSASSSAGTASIGGGAGREALSGGKTQKVFKKTIADVDPDFELGENEAFMDVNIHTILRPIEDAGGEISGSETECETEIARSGDAGETPRNCRTSGQGIEKNSSRNISEETALEKVWCMELVDRESGEVYHTYEFPEEEADLYLGGRVDVVNDDPAYEDSPLPVCEAVSPIIHEVRYGSDDSIAGTVPLQRIPVYEESEADYVSDSSPVFRETGYSASRSANSSMVVRGNVGESDNIIPDSISLSELEPEDSAERTSSAALNGTSGRTVEGSTGGNGSNSSPAPSWATSEGAEAAPPAQIESINPRTGQALAPPPQPGISNTDETPFTRPIGDVPAPGFSYEDWQRRSLPITVETEETTTGRIMFSLGVSSDSGLVGSFVVDEQNFDIRRWPTSWSDIKSGTSWRGRGQHFRMELTPGTEVSRYVMSFDEPYLFNTQIGLGTSVMYYERNYEHWDERRVGGQFNFSRALTHDLRAYLGFRGYEVYLSDPVYPTPPRLEEALGYSKLFGFSFRLVQDRRDSSFLATEGYYASIELEQVVGSWSYPRFNAQFKKYWLLYERADMSGRHVLSFTSSFSWTGDNTPIYESYFAGGSSTIRGFEYRGVSPLEMGYPVGGNVMVLASLEYLFPITADDMIRGVVFCDTGTVQSRIDEWDDCYRVSIGAGFRISMPMLGPAPMALDFAVPLVKERGDEKELFSFQMGLQR